MHDEYAVFSKVYDLLLDPFLAPMRREVAAVVTAQGWTRVLDVGGGTGRQCQQLAAQGVHCLLLDASPAMVRVAARHRHCRYQVIQGDARQSPINRQGVDAVCFSLCLHEMAQPLRLAALAEARRVADHVVVADYVSGRTPPWHTRAMRLGVHAPERMAGRRHYREFCDFMARGGAEAVLQEAGYTIRERRPLMAGVMAVIRAEAAPL